AADDFDDGGKQPRARPPRPGASLNRSIPRRPPTYPSPNRWKGGHEEVVLLPRLRCEEGRTDADGGLDDKVVAFQDINPSAFRHYLVIPIEHIPTVKNLQRTNEDHQLVSHMVKVGKDLLSRDAPKSEEHRFGFHQPPFNSIDHLHLHCLALPFIPSWRQVKYTPLGPLGGFIDAEKVLEKIKPETEVYS
uniref:HIT domain-containing protein n=1 Tax=Triticum urartu TaxID=4572 RepID=A0A8R7PHD6_TRIUA